jgi:mannose-6-phosphate isomerase-like protein (cupin superfamily)
VAEAGQENTHMPTKKLNELPLELNEAGAEVRATQWGNMNVGIEKWPVGDYSDLFTGLPKNQCQGAHFGYCLKGRATAITSSGKEQLRAGEVYYLPPGHSFRVEEALEVVEFTPLDGGYQQTMEVAMQNLPKVLERLRGRMKTA